MKNPLHIILTVLGALCAAACIALIVIIILNGNNHPPAVNSEAAIPIPERFREIADTSAPLPGDSSNSIPALPLTKEPSPPYYTGTVVCTDMVSSVSLKDLLLQRDLFCTKSQWSKQWAHPSGRGIRIKAAGLSFEDSVVTDTLTHRMWQRHSTFSKVKYGDMEAAIEKLNTCGWQGYRDWRVPTIEELMVLLTPAKNRHSLHLPGPWNCREKDFWSCNPAADSLSVKWVWVVRMGAGRCNYGHPDMARAMLAVREY